MPSDVCKAGLKFNRVSECFLRIKWESSVAGEACSIQCRLDLCR